MLVARHVASIRALPAWQIVWSLRPGALVVPLAVGIAVARRIERIGRGWRGERQQEREHQPSAHRTLPGARPARYRCALVCAAMDLQWDARTKSFDSAEEIHVVELGGSWRHWDDSRMRTRLHQWGDRLLIAPRGLNIFFAVRLCHRRSCSSSSGSSGLPGIP